MAWFSRLDTFFMCFMVECYPIRVCFIYLKRSHDLKWCHIDLMDLCVGGFPHNW